MKLNNNRCERSDEIESTKHLLWGCVEARNIWNLFNIWSANNGNDINNRLTKSINEYQDNFFIYECAHVCNVKMKIIQEMIQIQLPNGWNLEQIHLLSKDIAKIEAHNKKK